MAGSLFGVSRLHMMGSIQPGSCVPGCIEPRQVAVLPSATDVHSTSVQYCRNIGPVQKRTSAEQRDKARGKNSGVLHSKQQSVVWACRADRLTLLSPTVPVDYCCWP